ncbi:hypothetical protein JNW91_04355 [Micromonospora sp. STR1_7]|uniref:4Fe-4S Wbl-type domain-containing protein n=1 Tax=Micromonospora parastrephiae TaxID=2806101 RepID=A0ABS1XPK5_9ACTN|nr:hypothetical protein [Micromonospora parastrephiae]MBM0231177.1 hypothetical protein [Micromonospora parastrephiae]
MAATIYLSAAAIDQLTAAQRTLAEHVTSSATGYCLRCRLVGPCPTNEQAAATFTGYGRLPRRTPGATRPQLINARRLTASPDPAAGLTRRYQP